jgi:S1-C subfamily serine protease
MVLPCAAQDSNSTNTKTSAEMPIATQWLFDAADEVERAEISSVLLVRCHNTKGTGFHIRAGFVVTNNHVVQGCAVDEILARSALGRTVHFSKIVTDPERDLAVLRPFVPLEGGLELAGNDTPKVGSAVSTWGYPLMFDGPAPLFTAGYVAGYVQSRSRGNKTVKHIVVNGELNPGNSGGPLLSRQDSKVIGIVVIKILPFSSEAVGSMNFLQDTEWLSSGMCTGYISLPNGGHMCQSEAQYKLIKELYQNAQVGIAEAISVSELKALLNERAEELKCSTCKWQ